MPAHVDDDVSTIHQEYLAGSTLQDYLAGVLRKAGHHAANVRLAVLPLIGAIVLFRDRNDHIEVMTREGEMTNVLWVRIGASRYAFSYEDESKSVVMRRGTTQGEALAHFTNATSIATILSVFEALPKQ